MPNIIEEYLVKLGFSTDVPGYDKFQKSLADAGSLVSRNTSGMVRHVAEFETAAITGFAAVGAAAITMADKAAMADQSYRLFALHMFTSKTVARELKIGLDAVGASLEEVINDKELQTRFAAFIELQKSIAMPREFDANMRKIRDLRQSFINLYEIIDKIFIPVITSALVKIFGGNMDTVQKKVEDFTKYLTQHMPEMSDWIAQKLAPVLRDAKDIMFELWTITKQVLLAFTNLIGLLSGDKTLEDSTLNFEKLAKAIEKTVKFIGEATLGMLKLIANIAKLANAAMLMQQGDVKGAYAALASMETIAAPDKLESGYTKAGKWLGKKAVGTLVPFGGGYVMDYLEKKLDAAQAAQDAQLKRDIKVPAAPGVAKPTALPAQKSIQQMIVAQAVAMGVDPNIALAVAFKESSFQQFTKAGGVLENPKAVGQEHAMGVMGLLPSTAKGLGVDPRDTEQNIRGGIKLLAQNMAKYHDIRTAIAHYEGRGGPESRDKAKEIIDLGMTIGTITINVHGGDPKKTEEAVVAGLARVQRQQKLRTQRNLAEFGNQPAYGGG